MGVGIKSESVIMDIWNKNLEVIRQKSPELAGVLSSAIIPADHHVLATKKGPPTLQVGRQRLHSSYDPMEEGTAWARAQGIGDREPVVIFGLGLGYHVLPLLEEGREVWVVEPSAAVARLALEHQDLTHLWDRGGLVVGRDFATGAQGLAPAGLPSQPPAAWRAVSPMGGASGRGGRHRRLSAHPHRRSPLWRLPPHSLRLCPGLQQSGAQVGVAGFRALLPWVSSPKRGNPRQGHRTQAHPGSAEVPGRDTPGPGAGFSSGCGFFSGPGAGGPPASQGPAPGRDAPGLLVRGGLPGISRTGGTWRRKWTPFLLSNGNHFSAN